MKLLVVAPYPPTPPLSGGRRRILEEVQYLSRENTVDLACLTYDAQEDASLLRLQSPTLRAFGIRHTWANRNREGVERFPEPFEKFWCRSLQDLVTSLARKHRYDWVIAEHSYAAPYTEALATRKVMTAHNIEYRIFEQLAGMSEDLDLVFSLSGRSGELFRDASEIFGQLYQFEREMWQSMDVCASVSLDEQQILAEVLTSGRLLLTPNCPGCAVESVSLRPGPPSIVFFGSLNYLPNVDAVLYLVRSIVPLVRRESRNIEVLIAGRDPEPRLIEFCQKSGVRVIVNPATYDEVFTSGSILVCPLRFGAGTRIKVLDAMALGLPNVATALAVEGLKVLAGRDFVQAESAIDFSQALLELSRSKSRREEIAAGGRSFLRANRLQWPTVFANFEGHLRAEIGSPVHTASGIS